MNKEQEISKEGNRNENPLYSNTPYDDAFRTMESECDDLLIPLVNYFFHEDYGEDTEVLRLRNEHFVEDPDGSNRRKISDSHFAMRRRGRCKWYHMECESGKYDGTVLVRMFEYESQIALDESVKGRTKLVLNFPYAGILLLRGGENDPSEAEIEIHTPKENISYKIPIVKESDFDMETIFEKRLYFLIPFYIFNYERRFDEIEEDETAREELLSVYRDIFTRLETETSEGKLSTYSQGVIINMMASVWHNISSGHDNIQKRAGDIMGGKVMDLDWIRAHREWTAEGEKIGREEGRDINLVSLVCKKLAKGKDASQIADEVEEDITDVEAIIKAASPFDPNKYDVEAIRKKWREESGNSDMKEEEMKAAMA